MYRKKINGSEMEGVRLILKKTFDGWYIGVGYGLYVRGSWGCTVVGV